MKNYYTAEEAIKRLAIPRSTFYDRVKAGEITRITVPLRKQYLYPKAQIDQLAEEKARILGELEQPSRLAFVVPEYDDLVQLVDIDRMIFHEETLILPEEQQKRFAYNPEAMHVLKDTKTNTVLGGITLSPLKPSVLEKLIELEIDETEIKPEDYQPFTADHPQDCYIVGIVARPSLIETYYAGKLLRAATEYLISLLDRGIIIRRIYTVATTKQGDRLAQSFHFTLLKANLDVQNEEFRKSYVLNLEDANNSSKLVKAYLQARKNMERRVKRYKKQAKRLSNDSKTDSN
jgi:excisionase family DNA binding protein